MTLKLVVHTRHQQQQKFIHQAIILSCFPYSEITTNHNHFTEFNYDHNGFHEHKMKPFRQTLDHRDSKFTQNIDRPFQHNQQTEVTYCLRSRVIFKREENPSGEKSYKNRRFGSVDISQLLKNVKAKQQRQNTQQTLHLMLL